MRVTFRRGTEADARSAADLWLRARKSASGVIPEPVHSDDDVREWFACHVAGETELWMAEDLSGKLAGILLPAEARVRPRLLPRRCPRP